MVDKGKFNVMEIVLGVPGTGKSTYTIARAKELQKEYGGILVAAHDPDWRLPEGPSLVRYDSIGEAATGFKTRPGAIHAVTIADGQKLVEWAIQCGQSSLANPRRQGLPILVLLDDATQTKGLSRMRVSDEMLNTIVGRRHKHVGFIVSIQDPQFGHYSLMSQANQFTIFRMIDKSALDRLARFGVTEEMQQKIESLPDFHYLIHKTRK